MSLVLLPNVLKLPCSGIAYLARAFADAANVEGPWMHREGPARLGGRTVHDLAVSSAGRRGGANER